MTMQNNWRKNCSLWSSLCRFLGFEFEKIYSTTLSFITQFLYQNWRWNWQVPLAQHPDKDRSRSNLLKRNKKLSLLPNFPMPAALGKLFLQKKKKIYKHRYKKQQLPLFNFPSHVTWFFNPLWCLDPCFPARAKGNCFQESPSSVCLQTIPSLPIRQTSGMETPAQLPCGTLFGDRGQAVLCQNASEDAEVSIGWDKWAGFWPED